MLQYGWLGKAWVSLFVFFKIMTIVMVIMTMMTSIIAFPAINWYNNATKPTQGFYIEQILHSETLEHWTLLILAGPVQDAEVSYKLA